MIQYPVLLLFLSVSVDSQLPPPCFLKCKDNYMNGMQFDMGDSQEWSTDMITPINSLLKTGTKLPIRLTKSCRRNDEYHRCLKRCPDGDAKNILIQGQNVWMNMCEHFRNDSEFRNSVVPCWAEYGEEISSRCEDLAKFLQSETQALQQTGSGGIGERLESLCKTTHNYDKCFVDENFSYCGNSAAKFLVYLNHLSSHAFLDLLEKHGTIRTYPKSCKDWQNSKGMSAWSKSRAAQRKLRNSAQLPFALFSLIIVVFVT